MSTTLIVILAFLVLLVGLITFNYYRMKNIKPVSDSDKIKVLGNKNIPTLIMFHDGREVRRYMGVKTKKFLLKEIATELG